jgi:hypothetical protein
MTTDLTKHFTQDLRDKLTNAAREGTLIPFVGSGLSRYALDAPAADESTEGAGLPSGVGSASLFRPRDFKDPAALAKLRQEGQAPRSLLDGQDPLSQYLRKRFSSETQQLLQARTDAGPMSEPLQTALINDLNKLLKDPLLYKAEPFAQVKPSKQAQNLIAQHPKDEELIIRLNRLLLAEAYPNELAKSVLFPNWYDLTEALIDEAIVNNYITPELGATFRKFLEDCWNAPRFPGDFSYVAESLRIKIPITNYQKLLAEQFALKIKQARLHNALVRLSPPFILTTNYDTLIEDTYARVKKQSADVYTYRQTDVVYRMMDNYQSEREQGPAIFKIFGTIRQPYEMILTPRDLRKSMAHERDLPSLLNNLFIRNTVVLIGYSERNIGLRLLLEELSDYLRSNYGPDYILLPTESVDKDVNRAFRKEYQITAVSGKTDEAIFQFMEEIIDEAKPESNGN